jgi:putative transport protein
MGIYEFLQEQHILNLFLILGLGLLIGKIRIGGVELGSVTGVLFGGLVAGHLGLPIPSASHDIGFVLFIYCVGVQAGPRFVGAFRQDGGKYVILSVVTAVSATLLAYVFARALDFDVGVAAGMLSGALTSTPTLVAAQDALNQGLTLPDGVSTEDVLGNLSTSYAITYVFGMAGLILFVSFLPKMLRINVADEAAQLAE